MSQNKLLNKVLELIPETDLIEAIEVLQLRLYGIQKEHSSQPPKPKSDIGDEQIKTLLLDFSNKVNSCTNWQIKIKATAFLDGVQSFYDRKNYLTDKQVAAVASYTKSLDQHN